MKEKIKRIRYKENIAGSLYTNYIFSADNKYYVNIETHNNLLYIYNKDGKLTYTDEFNNLEEAKDKVRKFLVSKGCFIGKEVKKGIYLNKKNKLKVIR